MIRNLTTFFFTLSFVVGCSSADKTRESTFFEKFSQLPIGSSFSKAVEQLGQPSEISKEGSDTVAVYSFFYEKHSSLIPRATLWMDKNQKITAKHFSLFKEAGDSMTRAEAEAYFKNSKFVVEDAPLPKNGHNIPSEKFLRDTASGISIEYRPHMSSIDNIHWYQPGVRSLSSSEQRK